MRIAFIALALSAVVSACDSQADLGDGPGVRFRLNGEAVALDTVFVGPNDDGSASWGGEYCVEGAFPRNLGLSLSLPDARPGTYPVVYGESVEPGEAQLLVNDGDGDAITGWYAPSRSRQPTVSVESYDPTTGRVRGRFSGRFVLDPAASSPREFRYFPDEVLVDDGVFDVAPTDEGAGRPSRQGPCT